MNDKQVEYEEYYKAIEDSSTAIELNPNNARALKSRGHCYAHLAEYERAIKDWSRAFEVESEHELD